MPLSFLGGQPVQRTSFAVYFGMAICFASAPAGAASLVEELRLLVDTNPQVQAGHKNVLAATEGVDEAFGDYLPNLDLRADYGYGYNDLRARRTGQGQPGGQPADAFEGSRESATLTLTQKLWDGGAREATYETAKLQRDAASTSLEATRQQVMLEGIAAYMNVLRQVRLLELSRQNEANIMTQLSLENERVERGSGIAVDVLQAKSRLQVAKERRVAVEGALKEAQARYMQIFGNAADVGSMARPRPPLDALPQSLDEAVEIAQRDNPAVESGAKQIAIANERRNVAEAGYYPRFDFELSGNYENDVDGVEGVRRDVTALLRANWNIFNGFATRAAVARTAFEHAAAQESQSHTRRRVTEQTRVAWEALDTARQRVALLQNAVNIAEEVYAARQRLREAGKDTALNVLDAENETFTARINYVSALFDAQIASYQVLAAMGKLSLEVIEAYGTTAGNEAAPVLAKQ